MVDETWSYAPKTGRKSREAERLAGVPLLTWHPDAGFRIMTMRPTPEEGVVWWCSMDSDPEYMAVGEDWAPTHFRALPPPPPKDPV
jgi:hypothetical protein